MNEHETYKTIPDLKEPFQPEFTTKSTISC